jgi:indoleamine 2,3-dioxygenase
MDFLRLLPSPTEIQCSALSALNTLLTYTRRSNDVILPQTDFDIDPITGFVPPEPLPRLPAEYKIWEDALTEAPEVLRLWDDNSDEALSLRAEGETWRATIRSVSVKKASIRAFTDNLI